MAKPNLAKAGSGMHFHMSLLNQYHQNIFSSEEEKDELATKLLSAISGLIELMPASMAILALILILIDVLKLVITCH